MRDQPGVVRAGALALLALALAGCISGGGGGDGVANGTAAGDAAADGPASGETTAPGTSQPVSDDAPPSPPGDAPDPGDDEGDAAPAPAFAVTILANPGYLSGPPFEDHPVSARATGINDAGDVVGWTTSGWVLGDAQGVLWADGNLLGIQHTQWTYPYGINAGGTIVGAAGSSGDVGLGAFLWQNGGSMFLGNPPRGDGWVVSEALDINAGGAVTGWVLPDVRQQRRRRAFLWEEGVMSDLGGLPGGEDASAGHAVNDRGQVVGGSTVPAGGDGSGTARRAFLWDSGTMTDLGIDDATAFDINNRGQVVGAGAVAGARRAFLWETGEVLDLGVLAGDDTSRASAINEAGQVVGVSQGDAGATPFLWRPEDGMVDLHALIDREPYGGALALIDVAGINASGQIAATAVIAGEEHAVVLTPRRRSQ